MERPKWHFPSVGLGVLLGAGALTLFSFFGILPSPSSGTKPAETRLGQNDLINPLLDCPQYPGLGPLNTARLKDRIQELIDLHERGGKGVESVAVYFRDLNNGPTFGINTGDKFIGASLMKTPVLIGFLKKQASEPGLFDRKMVFSSKPQKDPQDPVQTIDPPDVVKDQELRIGELLRRMIVESDNDASDFLQEKFPDVEVLKVLKEMGVPVKVEGGDGYVTVEDYASVFRILYNATYLDQERSRQALALMAESHFKSGLVAGVGPDVRISHKFGERGIGESRHFHDCGIVYYPQLPYLLCVMTRGTDQPQQIQVVREVSQAVYDQIRQETQK